MKLLLTAISGACLMSVGDARSQTLIEATTAAEAIAIIRAAETGRGDVIRDTVGLGLADPVDLVFALISPETPVREAERVAFAITLAAPRQADEVAASTAIAAAIVSDESRLIGLIGALLDALDMTPLEDVAREEERREVLAALLSVTNPELKLALADALSGGDGAALLAALGEGPETAAIAPPARPFGEGPVTLTLTPGSAAQDAPSAN